MNDKLISIDDDSLDLVSGGASFSFQPFGWINDFAKAIQALANLSITGEIGISVNGTPVV